MEGVEEGRVRVGSGVESWCWGEGLRSVKGRGVEGRCVQGGGARGPCGGLRRVGAGMVV